MANISIAFNSVLKPFPFQIPGGAVQSFTAIPLSRILCTVTGGVITAKIATNTTAINVTTTLPANFAYTIEYATINVAMATSTTDADNFDDIGSMTFNQTELHAFSRVNLVAPGIFGVSGNAGSSKAWEPDNPYGGPLFNRTGDEVLVNMELNDRDAGATVLGSLAAIVAVLQYDYSQVFNYPINFALPVTQRGA